MAAIAASPPAVASQSHDSSSSHKGHGIHLLRSIKGLKKKNKDPAKHSRSGIDLVGSANATDSLSAKHVGLRRTKSHSVVTSAATRARAVSPPLMKVSSHGDVARLNTHRYSPSMPNPALTPAEQSRLLRRSNSSTARRPKMQYNPYGLLGQNRPTDVGSIFGTGSLQPESSLLLPYPTEDPNKYLPEPFRERCQTFEELYEANINALSIGSGGAATIKKMRVKSNPSVQVALKKFSLFRGERPYSYYHRVASEYTVMRNCRSLHVVPAYELLKLPVYLQRSWGMTMQYLPCDLFTQVTSSSWRTTPMAERLCYFKQVCLGVKYLHENDITHLDIKPDNILVSENGILRLTDFGCCEYGHKEPGNFKSPVKLHNKMLGTPPYQPPEVAVYKKSDDLSDRKPYDPFKFDYWSLGLLLFVIVSGKTPFQDCKSTDYNFLDYESNYLRFCGLYPGFLNNETQHCPSVGRFCEPFGNPRLARIGWRLCDMNPRTRLTLPQLFEDDFFQSIEMCIDEAGYEANFIHHKAAKDLKFRAEYGSTAELVLNNKSHRRASSSASRVDPLSTSVPALGPIIPMVQTKTPKTPLSIKSSAASSPVTPSPTSSVSAPPHKYESMVEMGLRGRQRQNSHGSINSGSSSGAVNANANGRGSSGPATGRNPSVHYQIDLNSVEEKEEEDKDDRDGKEEDSGSSTLTKPRSSVSLSDTSKPTLVSRGGRKMDSGSSSSLVNSPTGIDFEKYEIRYENAITEDDSSSQLTSTSKDSKDSSLAPTEAPAESPSAAQTRFSVVHPSAADPETDGTNELVSLDNRAFILPNGSIADYEFDESDYQNKETEYMVVSYDMIVKSTKTPQVAHAHTLHTRANSVSH